MPSIGNALTASEGTVVVTTTGGNVTVSVTGIALAFAIGTPAVEISTTVHVIGLTMSAVAGYVGIVRYGPADFSFPRSGSTCISKDRNRLTRAKNPGRAASQ